MNIIAKFRSEIEIILQQLKAEEVISSTHLRFNVNAPRKAEHGDLSCNVGAVYAAQSQSTGLGLASIIAARLDVGRTFYESIDVVKPGFINVTLTQSALYEAAKETVFFHDYSKSPISSKPSTLIEFVSANPTGPMHIGHARGAVIGDAVARLLAAMGTPVSKEYYINDAGAQVDILARSVYFRYLQALGEPADPPADFYPGDYLIPVGQGLMEHFGRSIVDKDKDKWLPLIREVAIKVMMDLIKADLASINVHHNKFVHEREIAGMDILSPLRGPTIQKVVADHIAASSTERAIQKLRDLDLVYEGQVEEPKGEIDPDWSPKTLTLFRSTKFGDEVDRVIAREDGTRTYFANDIGYHADKIERAEHLINVWGTDHHGYVPRVSNVVSVLSEGRVKLEVLLCAMVSLTRGEWNKLNKTPPVNMSKRSGNYVTLRDVVDEVGADAVRFMMLMVRSDSPMDFNLDRVKETTKDNPVFYVQYAHARASSVLRKANHLLIDNEADGSRLTDPSERALLRRVLEFPNVVEMAAAAREPHKVAHYLYDLASIFHSHFSAGGKDSSLAFIVPENTELTLDRCSLVAIVRKTIARGLFLLGVTAPTEMSRPETADVAAA